MTLMEQRQESRVRSLARRMGYAIRKSRCAVSRDNAGYFMLLEAHTGYPVLGFRFDADLDEIEAWLRGDDDESDAAAGVH